LLRPASRQAPSCLPSSAHWQPSPWAVLGSWPPRRPGLCRPRTSSTTAPCPLAGNIPSYGGEAYSFNEIGNEVNLAPSTEPLTDVTVTMSSWACETGGWTGPTPCTTTPGQTYAVPITFNIYNPGATPGTVGSLITTETQSFNIPYRPSANSVTNPGGTQCSGAPNGESECTTPPRHLLQRTRRQRQVRLHLEERDPPEHRRLRHLLRHRQSRPEPHRRHHEPHRFAQRGIHHRVHRRLGRLGRQSGEHLRQFRERDQHQPLLQHGYAGCLHGSSNGCVSGSPPTNDIPAVQFATATSHGPSQQTGYWTVASDGGVFSYGRSSTARWATSI